MSKCIGLIAVDSNFPNLALMKISAYHKSQGDIVEWYTPFQSYDIVYMSKIFSFTSDFTQVINNANKIEKGGTGYSVTSSLPDYIDRLQPDYSIYNVDKNLAYGFLTRGCPNKCKWCVVPEKEGKVRPYMDIEEIIDGGKKKAILMDNNILASDYGLSQIEKIIKLGVKVDFNQALDARLVDNEIAALLTKVKWIRYPRFGCDSTPQIKHVEKAIELMDKNGFTGQYMLYCILLNDISESYNRVNIWRCNERILPYAQPFRDYTKTMDCIPQWQKDMARWVNRREIYTTCSFDEYEPRKGFKCKEYLNK